MAHSKDLSKYPQYIHDLLRLEEHNLPLTIPCVDKRAAMRLRFEIHSFFDALIHNKHPHAAKMGMIKVRMDNNLIILDKRDRDEFGLAEAIRRATENAVPPPTPVTPSSSVLDGTQMNQGPASPIGQDHEAALQRYLKGEKS